MKTKRQAGFIKNYSEHKIDPIIEQSAEFSYFKLHGRTNSNDQFSPYKDQNQEILRNYQHPFIKKINFQKTFHQSKVNQKYSFNQKQSGYFRKPAEAKVIAAEQSEKDSNKLHSKTKINNDIGEIKQKIGNIDKAMKDLENKKCFQNFKPLTSAATYYRKDPLKDMKKFKESSNQSNSSNQEESEQSDEKKNIEKEVLQKDLFIEKELQRNMENKMCRISPKHQSSSSDSENQSREVQYEAKPPKIDYVLHDVMKNKGGICFDVDVKQFAKPIKEIVSPKNGNQQNSNAKHKKDINSKEEILRRRELAKMYDRKARYELLHQK